MDLNGIAFAPALPCESDRADCSAHGDCVVEVF